MATVDIELYYDLDRRRWTTSAGGLAAQPSLFIGQSNTIDFKVRFVQGGVPIELTSPSWIAGIKVTDDPLGDYLLLTTTGTQTGTGATTIYTFSLNIDSVELQAYLVGITPSTNSTAFEVRDTVNNIATLPAITCSILPDYTLTGATPAAASGTLVVDSGATFTVHKTFAMPTDDGQNNYVLKTDGAGVGSWAVDSAGTGTVQSVSVTTANGVSGSVATSTTTPAITLTLGAITPTTGAFSDATDATNSTTAPLKTAGGLAVAKSLYVGQLSHFGDNAEFSGDLRVHNIVELGGTSMAFTDQSSNPTFEIFSVADSVNSVAIYPGVPGSPPHILAQGSDTNIGLHLQAKGTGFVNVQDGTDTTKRLRFGASGNGTGITTTLASSSTTSQTITLPNATGATTLAGLQMTQSFTQANTFSLITDATSSTVGGSVTIAGGLAVAKKAYIGTLLDLVATTATAGQLTQAGTRLLHTYGGGGNLFLGTGAGTLTLSGTGHNCGIGYGSLASLANNNGYNTGLGSYSLNGVTTGSGNMGIGYGAAGGANCSNNTAIGYQSLNNTSGGNNTATGFNTGQSTGAIGGLTALAITTGTNNTIIGSSAGITSSTGTYRTAIGSDSRCQNNNAIKLGRDTLDVVILPSMTTTERNAVTSPAGGSLIFNSTTSKLNFYNGTAWEAVTSA